MTDLSTTIAPKSNQLNADDLISGPRTVTVTKVGQGSAEQPIAVSFDGDGGKPYFPCKSMRRVMVMVWGPDGSQYAGRSMTLYRDPSVQWGGIAVGGIRISHMSDLKESRTMSLTETKKSRKPFTVKPLIALQEQPQQVAQQKKGTVENYRERLESFSTTDQVAELQGVWLKTVEGRKQEGKSIPEAIATELDKLFNRHFERCQMSVDADGVIDDLDGPVMAQGEAA